MDSISWPYIISCVSDVWLPVTYWKGNNTCIKHHRAKLSSNNKYLFDLKWTIFLPYSQLLEICWTLPKDRVVTKTSVISGADQGTYFPLTCEDNQQCFWPCMFLLWRKLDLTLQEGGGNALGVSGEVYCPLTPEQPALLRFFYYCLRMPVHADVGSLTVNSNIEKGISTFHLPTL